MARFVFAVLFVLLAVLAPKLFPKNKTRIKVDEDGNKVSEEIESSARKYIPLVRMISGALALFLIFSTSYVIIDSNRPSSPSSNLPEKMLACTIFCTL